MKRVFVNGYGSIGSRISNFINDDPEIQLLGVGKYSPDNKTNDIINSGLSVFVPNSRLTNFNNFKISGSIEDALKDCDLVIDATPGGQGYKNKKSLYEPNNLKVIYQGGESTTDENSVSDLIFNSRVNYEAAFDATHIMQGSCNVTGMGRILEPLRQEYDSKLLRFDVTLVRRWADIEQTDKEIIDTIEMTQKPHHGDDVKSYFGKDSPLFVRAIKVPTRQMHLHIMDIRFDGKAPDVDEIHQLFKNDNGVAVLKNAKGTKDVRDFANSMKFSFKDTNMIHIHTNMSISINDTVQIMYSDDQTGIVIPENHMLMQAMLFKKSYSDASKHTEELFHMKEKKSQLEKHFSN